MVKYITIFIALLFTSCKAKHQNTSTSATTQHTEIQAERLERLEGQTLHLVDTWQTIERFDTLGRITERRTIERKARTERSEQATATTSTSAKATARTERKETKQTERKALSPPSWMLMSLAFALGIALSGYIAWRWLIRR